MFLLKRKKNETRKTGLSVPLVTPMVYITAQAVGACRINSPRSVTPNHGKYKYSLILFR